MFLFLQAWDCFYHNSRFYHSSGKLESPKTKAWLKRNEGERDNGNNTDRQVQISVERA